MRRCGLYRELRHDQPRLGSDPSAAPPPSSPNELFLTLDLRLILALCVFVFPASLIVLGAVKSVQDIEETVSSLRRALGGRSLGAISERLWCLGEHPRPAAQDRREALSYSIV